MLVEKHDKQKPKAKAPLPAEFAELIDLHRAFLKAVALRFAHDGSSVPLALAELLPGVAQAWGKRAVTVEDVRRCVAVENVQRAGAEAAAASGSPFVICDYGRGRICLELDDEHAGAPINEKRLCRAFERNLATLHARRDAERRDEPAAAEGEGGAMELDVVDIPLEALSLADLPQAPIAARAAQFSVNPLLARGQRALAELKNGIAERRALERDAKLGRKSAALSALDAAVAQQDITPTTTTTTATTTPTTTPTTTTTVLDRIRAKQLAKAHAPAPPSAAELERRAALQRAVDVAGVVRALTRATGRGLPRVAVPMPALLLRLRDSLRVPLSGDEGAAAVRLLAREVAPEWLKIVVVGGRETVVVQVHGELSDRAVAERAERFA